jgi:phosphoglycerate kinase
MKSISSLPSLKGARVIVRVDYNVPFAGARIADARRIEASYKTIDVILKKGGTPVLLAHLGDGSATLVPVAKFLKKKYTTVFIADDLKDKKTVTEKLAAVKKGSIVLFENIRRYTGEEKNTASFGKLLASYGSYYVNDAFSVSHRAHASVVGIAKHLPSYGGAQLAAEIAALAPVVKNPKHPFVFILGGAKFATKIPLISRFIDTADQVVIGGAILNNFYKVAGFEVGNSVVEKGYDKQLAALMDKSNLLLPIDVLVTRAGQTVAVTADEVQPGDVIVDIGPQSVELISQKIAKAKIVVWNGPMGWYEKGFTKGTIGLAKAIGISKAHAVIGGGDTGAALEKVLKKSTNKKIFVSTGGGAALDYLAKGTLPGIKALE